MSKLKINARPEAFDSTLPPGVEGDTSLLDDLTIKKIKSIELDKVSDYEENLDGEYRIYLKNGDEIHFDGYAGLWALMYYDSFKKKAQKQILSQLKDVLVYYIEILDEQKKTAKKKTAKKKKS